MAILIPREALDYDLLFSPCKYEACSDAMMWKIAQ